MKKKYIITNETKQVCCQKLYRIIAVKDFGDVKAGELGGFIEKEDNLSHDGDAWVYDNAMVCSNAKVYGNAQICDNAQIRGNAKVFGDAKISGNAWIYDGAKVYGDAWVSGGAKICGNADVYGNAWVRDNAHVHDNVKIYGKTWVFENAQIYGNVEIYGKAQVCNNAFISGNALICDKTGYIVFKNWWSSGRNFTWTRSNNMWSVGCFYGTGEELIAKAYKDSELSGREYERVVKYVESILADEEADNQNR